MPTKMQKRAIGSNIIHEQWSIDYTELIDASTTQSLDLTTLPAGAVGLAAYINVTAAATDAGSISALTIEVGDTADPDAVVDGVDMFAVTGLVQNVAVGSTEMWSGMTVAAKFTATGANLGSGSATDLDSGAVQVHLVYLVV
jgi:hypothetical protein